MENDDIREDLCLFSLREKINSQTEINITPRPWIINFDRFLIAYKTHDFLSESLSSVLRSSKCLYCVETSYSLRGLDVNSGE
jgi:hypothetical protein